MTGDGAHLGGMSETFRRAIHPEIKIISESEGLVDYIASDESLDAQREIIKASGWRFNRFAKNAPFIDSHCYDNISSLLGRVISFEVKGGKLIERVKWAIDVPEQSLAKLGFALTVKGYLKAVSVGFQSLSCVCNGSPEFVRAVQQMKLEPSIVAGLRCIHLEQDQLELSACVIGSNPNAVARAYHANDISEGDLARCGFADEELDLLLKTGAAWESADDATQYKIKTLLRAVQRQGALFGKSPPAPSSHTPGGDDEAQRQAGEQRKQFLDKLTAAITPL